MKEYCKIKELVIILLNDGINVCVFFFVGIVESILYEIEIEVFFENLLKVVEVIIQFLLEEINEYCDMGKIYDILEVYEIFC